MTKYTIAQAGAGARGVIHIEGIQANADRMELVGLCDLDAEKLSSVGERYGVDCLFADAQEMLAETKPDIFCFVTPPSVRIDMVRLAVEHGVKGLMFEKPMATSLAEAREITDLCSEAGIKATVCHQHKYLTTMRNLQHIVVSGDLGEVKTVETTCLAWLAQLGTHYVDYMLWVNGQHRAKWVCGHCHGREKLADSHPSPDYVMGTMEFENGVRGEVQFGYLSPRHLPDSWVDGKPGPRFWLEDRLMVRGTHGYAWADAAGRWGAFTSTTNGEVIGEEGPGFMEEHTAMQVHYTADVVAWLDDDTQVHPNNLAISYHGYEVMEALCLSALDNTRIDLPLEDPSAGGDVFERMRAELPDVAPLP